MTNKKIISLLIILFAIFYIFIGTGLHGDDLLFIKKLKDVSFWQFIIPSLKYTDSHILTLPSFYYLFIVYWIIGETNQYIYDILKIFYILISIYFYSKFFSLFFDQSKSIIFSFFIIFFPSHETTLFWYVTSSYNLVPALILYSFYLFNINYYKTSLSLLIFSTFSFYVSLPFVFGIAFYSLFRKNYNLFIIYFLIGLAYVIYVNVIFLFYEDLNTKTSTNLKNDILNIYSIILQLLSSLESIFGPSIFIKIFSAYKNLKLIDILISIIIIILTLFNMNDFKKFNYKNYLNISILIFTIYFSSILYVSMTNSYYHTAYNLGNRITIYPTFLIILIISLINKKNILLLSLYLIVILPLFGLSNHWKDWNDNQLNLIKNINDNKDLNSLKINDTLIVEGNRYSNLNGIDHIELFAMPWIIKTVFSNYKIKNAISLSKNLDYKNNKLINKKYDYHYELGDRIFIYNTNLNTLKKIDKYQIENLINNSNQDYRHWLQKINSDNPIIVLIKKIKPDLTNVFK